MLHEIGVQIQARLVEKLCPIPVIDGPELRPATTFGRERIVIEHDMESTDSFEPRHRANKGSTAGPPNGTTHLTRQMASKATLWVKSPRPGAIYWEHVRRAEHLLDLVLTSLYVIASGRQNICKFRSGKFLFPPDLKASETFGGAVYELKFDFDRGVRNIDWLFGFGPSTVVSPQLVGGPELTFAPGTITRAFGSWIADKFAVGQTVIVTGSSLNNGTFGPITAVNASTLTFASGLTNEGPVAAMVTGNGTLISNSVEGDGEIS